jgi:hypothetical protein
MLFEKRILTLSTADENVIVRKYTLREEASWTYVLTTKYNCMSNQIESSVIAQLLNDFHRPFKDEEYLLNYKLYKHQPMKYSIYYALYY